MSALINQCKKLKGSADFLANLDAKTKNEALLQVAKSLVRNADYILEENHKDLKIANQNMKQTLVDRLKLNKDRINAMVDSIYNIIDLKDPVWRSDQVWTLENGLTISKMNVPIGVIGIIYESRPNVTVDAFALALKSGNALLLRGSSSSLHSNKALVYAIKDGLKNSDISQDVVGFIADSDRAIVKEMLSLNSYIDLIIPRGGKELIDFVINNSTVPTIETGVGNCHIFIDKSADLDKAVDILENAKTQRPGVCNACETLLVHRDIARDFLVKAHSRLGEKVEFRGCVETSKIIDVKPAQDSDWSEEYLDYILAVKIVEDVNTAIQHINKYGTKHSEAILTENLTNSNKFLRSVDAAAVYVNSSTR